MKRDVQVLEAYTERVPVEGNSTPIPFQFISTQVGTDISIEGLYTLLLHSPGAYRVSVTATVSSENAIGFAAIQLLEDGVLAPQACAGSTLKGETVVSDDDETIQVSSIETLSFTTFVRVDDISVEPKRLRVMNLGISVMFETMDICIDKLICTPVRKQIVKRRKVIKIDQPALAIHGNQIAISMQLAKTIGRSLWKNARQRIFPLP